MSSRAGRLSEASILLVDDEPLLLDVYRSLFQKLGVGQVHTAGDGAAALDILKSQAIDLLITDVRMRGMDGMTLARELAAIEEATTRVIMVSGFADIDGREMYGAGVEAYLLKPVGTERLVRSMEEVLLPPSSRWLTPLKIPPRQALHISLDPQSHPSLLLGRGGFCISTAEPLFLGKTSFHCHLPKHPVPLSGQGHVRWISRSDLLVGVEIEYLDPACRSWVLEEIENNMAHSFIPEGRASSSPAMKPDSILKSSAAHGFVQKPGQQQGSPHVLNGSAPPVVHAPFEKLESISKVGSSAPYRGGKSAGHVSKP